MVIFGIIWFLISIGLVTFFGYTTSKGIITNYPLVAILTSFVVGVLAGLIIYGMIKNGSVNNEPPWAIIIYWIMLVIGSLSLWKWFSFSPHIFGDIKYLWVSIMFTGLAVCRLILYYCLGR